MIQSIVLQPLRNGEFIQFIYDFSNIVQTNDPDALKVRPQYAGLKGLADDLENLFKISQGSLITAEIEAMDQRRDRALTGIRTVAVGYTYHPDPALQNHGKALKAHFALFGNNIVRDNYLSQTASIRNILQDWDNKPDLQNALRALGLLDWSSALRIGDSGPCLPTLLVYVDPSFRHVDPPSGCDGFVSLCCHSGMLTQACGIGFLLAYAPGNQPLEMYAVTIDSVERLTGLSFFTGLPTTERAAVVKQKVLEDWFSEVATGDVVPVPIQELKRGQINTIMAKTAIGTSKNVTVVGKVVSGRVSRAGNVLLNLDNQYPNEIFTLFIKKEDVPNFGYDPVAYLQGKRIAVTGKVSELGGKPISI